MARMSETLRQVTEIVAVRGEGVYLYGEDGARYLDFSAGIAVASTGHCHPHVVEATQRQIATIIHAQTSIVVSKTLLRLCDELGRVLPDGFDRIFFGCSGSEANEGAIRLAKQATGRPNIVAFQGGFHGRSVGAASVTSSGTSARAGTGPLMPGVNFAPFPNPRRYGWPQAECTAFALKELDLLLEQLSNPDETAAFIVEPVQGEAGYIPGNRDFFQGLRERADQHGILLIFDEVQCGWGRTGQFWACEHFGVRPDILTMAKGMGSGFPISAVAAPHELMQRARPGSQGGTYVGNPVTCAAALATLEVIERENLVQNATDRGQELIEALRFGARDHRSIADVRGLGLMIGVEFCDPTGAPDGLAAARVQHEALSRGLLLVTCGPSRSVMRFAPPLVLTSDHVKEGVKVWAEALVAAGL